VSYVAENKYVTVNALLHSSIEETITGKCFYEDYPFRVPYKINILKYMMREL